MSYKYEPDWTIQTAMRVFAKCEHKVWMRPNGQRRYTLLRVEQHENGGWGIRFRVWPNGNSYILCGNAIEEEHWIEVKPTGGQ